MILVPKIQVGPDRTQVGLVQFTDMPVSEFHLGTYQTKQQVLGESVTKVIAPKITKKNNHNITPK